MQRLEVGGAVQPLYWTLGVKGLISFLFAFFKLFTRSPVLTLLFPLSFLYFHTSLYSFLPSILLLPPPPFITLTLSNFFGSVQTLAVRQVISLRPSVRPHVVAN